MKKTEENDIIWLGERTAFYKEALVIFSNDSMTVFEEGHLDPMPVDSYSVAPWGLNNDLPQQVMQKIDAAEVVSTNANFNWKVPFGQGPKLVEVIRDPETNRVKSFKEVLGSCVTTSRCC